MVRYCVAFGCSEKYVKGSGIQFHRFPLSRPNIFIAWEKAVRRQDWKPTINSHLCSKHFTKDSFVNGPGLIFNRLKEDAIPTIFSYKSENPTRTRKRLFSQTSITIESPIELLVEEDITVSLEGDVISTNSEEETPTPNLEEEITSTETGTFCQSGKIDKSIQTDARMSSPSKQVLRKEIRRLKRTVKLQTRKIQNFSQLLNELKEKVKISDDLENVL